MLYPEMTKSRMVFDLNGVWDFKLLKADEQYAPGENALCKDMIPMPVPSSYNDIYEGKAFADHVGDMLYKRKLTVTHQMLEGRLVLRFGSVTHKAEVWLNGECLGSHRGGFLPFQFDITGKAREGENDLAVVVNNIVDSTTLPAGRVVRQKFPGLPEEIHNLPNFDFYNYSGIMRPVCLYTMPRQYIEDITVYGRMDGSFSWETVCRGDGEVTVKVLDPSSKEVFSAGGRTGTGQLDSVSLWAPEHPAMYRLEVTLKGTDGEWDCYEEAFGFREVEIRDCHLCLNGKPVYLKGFGKHEDTPVRGRGFDMAYNVKDIALLKWIGANSFRTSHYPYCEEMLRLCDREGILVIDEAPAVGLHTGFSATGMLGGKPEGTWSQLKTAGHHREVLRDMVERDKNHPCVVIWSVANEPASEEDGAKEYFEPLVRLTKELDVQKRPVTLVTYEGSSPEACKVAELCDVIIINRYRGWYDTEGNLPGAAALLKDELERFHRRCPDKPIMLGEYGADTIAGLHDINSRLFSEEYQADFLKAYGEVFDSLAYITGEHVWNFADFATAENIKRVNGNKKGVFTRDRTPKMAAHFLRKRWKGAGY
ncbi:beta-glucuronidase [Clostridium sp. AN503]|uniref:beta-glucuronidase n=1 Tax=Clostridium sp. AN503 TaxID=3160598 RepID=UPI003458FABD